MIDPLFFGYDRNRKITARQFCFMLDFPTMRLISSALFGLCGNCFVPDPERGQFSLPILFDQLERPRAHAFVRIVEGEHEWID